MNFKRITLFAGHYGSGKTNLAINFSYLLKQHGHPTVIADLDTVNPYFRTKDSANELSSQGIELVASEFAGSNVDLPALPATIYKVVSNRSKYAVLDIGGDDRGAYALGRYVDAIKAEGDYRMAFVVNCYRPLTSTVRETVEIMHEIETACGLGFTCIINNSNLGEETTPETVLASADFVRELSELTGLPVWMTSVEESVAKGLSSPDVFPMRLQRKRF